MEAHFNAKGQGDQWEQSREFDTNVFKSKIKDWMRAHPEAVEEELQDYCEELIPTQSFAAYGWLVEHTLAWYKHILAQRDKTATYDYSEEDEM